MWVLAISFVGCGLKKTEEGAVMSKPNDVALLTCSDKTLENAYEWARQTAFSYSHEDKDPVGYWYEAALPQREAFCMRDVAHQSVGAQILGLDRQNKNMFTHFVENISENKDWCTYWEINRYNLPAPADYTSDKEFWYNLNANFDLIQACWKMYEWTGDTTYIHNVSFLNFYEKSLNEYVERWKLQPDSIMDRPLYMNEPANFDLNNNFHTCRGLASYVENFRDLTVSSDLLAALYAGYCAYAQMNRTLGDTAKASRQEIIALKYRELLENQWWNEQNKAYYNFFTVDKAFHNGEGDVFLLWFGVANQPERIRSTVDHLLQQQWNVETLSYLPALLYRLNYSEEAYRALINLPSMNRSNYPEVSYGIIEGVVSGMMGFVPSASKSCIMTMSHLLGIDEFAELKSISVFEGYVSLSHIGKRSSRLNNHTGRSFLWRAAFDGEHLELLVNGKKEKAIVATDLFGHVYSYVDINMTTNLACSVTIQ